MCRRREAVIICHAKTKQNLIPSEWDPNSVRGFVFCLPSKDDFPIHVYFWVGDWGEVFWIFVFNLLFVIKKRSWSVGELLFFYLELYLLYETNMEGEKWSEGPFTSASSNEATVTGFMIGASITSWGQGGKLRRHLCGNVLTKRRSGGSEVYVLYPLGMQFVKDSDEVDVVSTSLERWWKLMSEWEDSV
jgi:hypothetical protein